MIAFGVCIGSPEKFRQCAVPGLRRHAPADSPIAESEGNASILRAYNEMLDAFKDVPDLEALVLLHEDVELRDPRFAEKVRAALADPDVAVVGAVGARGVSSLEWWQGEGVGRCAETRGLVAFEERAGAVDVVDGLLLVLSPWAVRNLRFDEDTFTGFHAYDADFCFAARAAGRRVEVIDVELFHHTKGGLGDEVGFRLADAAFRVKWFGGTQQELVDCPACDAPLVPGPRHEQYVVGLCGTCGLGATLPAPTRQAESDGIWEEQYGGQRLAMRPQWLKEAELRISWLQLHAPDGRLLEVGSGTGELCSVAAAHGYDTYGVEPSAWAAEQGRQLGARVMTGDLAAWRDAHPGLALDVVAAFHVFEHVHDPHGFLEEVRSVLRPGGTLALEVPNFGSMHARRRTFEWIGTALTDHVFHYTAASLTSLLRVHGFEVRSTLNFSARVYESAASWAARRQMWRAAGLTDAPLDMLRIVATRSAEAAEVVDDRLEAAVA